MFYSFCEDLRYAYSIGEIKVRENRLLSQRDFNRLVSTVNAEEISAILNEAEYQTPDNAREISLNADRFLSINTGFLYKTVKKISYHPEIIDLFIVRYDFRNFGVLLKKKIAKDSFENRGISEKETLADLGLRGLNNLKKAFKKKNYELYPDKVAEIFLRLEKETKRENLNKINQILDKEYFRLALEVSSSNDFCRYVFKILVDFTNLNNFLRLLNIKKDISLLEQFYIDGGRIPKVDFMDFLNDRLNLSKLLSRYSYQRILSSSQGEKEDLPLIEKKLDDFLMDVLKETKFSFIGLESVIAYLLVKELEMKNIRLILQGKAVGLTQEKLVPYLRMTYV